MDSVGVDGDSLFDRLRPETLFAGDWAIVYQHPRITMACKTVALGVSLLRVEYESALSLPEAHETMRPEAYFDSRRPTFDSSMTECGVEQVLAPGDAVVWYRPVFNSKSTTLGIACAALVGASKAAADVFRVRWVIRADFPSVDQFAVVAAPFCAQTGTLQEESGVQRAIAISVRRQADDPERTALTEIRLLRQVPDGFIEHMAGYYLERCSWVAPYKLSQAYADIRSGRTAYVVVSIRKLTRGPPLLPREASGKGLDLASDWEPATNSTCAWYLQTFLERIGVEVDVHASLDGQKLPYYQAVLYRHDWHRARAALDRGPWRALGTAYRRMHGGTNAPKLEVSTPKFRGHLSVYALHTTHAASGPFAHEASESLPVVGTFVHYREPPGPKASRCNSDPEVDAVREVTPCTDGRRGRGFRRASGVFTCVMSAYGQMRRRE